MTHPRVEWLLVDEHEVPDGDDWLGPRERVHQPAGRIPKRRADWRRGRCAAKALLRASRDASLTEEVEILAAEDGAPELWLGADRLDGTVSISHSGALAVAAICRPTAALGCDIEALEPRSQAFVDDWFTGHERAQVATSPRPDVVTNTIWSAKESALKALRIGLRADTRSVEVSLSTDPGEVSSIVVIERATRRQFSGYAIRLQGFVATIVAAPEVGELVRLGRIEEQER